VQRRDVLYDVTHGVTVGSSPAVGATQLAYIRNESNIDLYTFDRTDVSFNIRKDF